MAISVSKIKSVIARFTQEDTYRGDGLNLYAYCANNPVSYVDPSGHVQRAYGGVCTTNLAHESHEKVTAGEGRRAEDNKSGSQTRKTINRPSSKKVKIDMEEVISGHTSGGQRAQQSQIKDLFPDGMNSNAIETEIRRAYGNAKQVGSPQFDGVNTRIKLQGKNGVIEMWFNKSIWAIETAYSIYGKKIKIMEIIISEDNVSLGSTSGLITGQIYFRINDTYFPEINWNDFFVIILGWWVNSFIDAIKSNADRFEFQFMDGPFFAEAKLKNNKVYEIYFWRSNLYDKELIMTANVCQKEMHNMLIKACRRAFKVLSLAGIPSSNMDGLKKSFEMLKSYS